MNIHRLFCFLPFILFINGCVVGPWKMYEGADLPRDEVAVLPVRGPTYRIDQVDGERVGNVWQGQTGLSEIHVMPGQHKLLVAVAEEMDDGSPGWTLLYMFVDLEAQDGYVVKHAPQPSNKVRAWMEDKDGNVVSLH